MGLISVAAFRPHPGKEGELRSVIADRLPLLRRLGLATERAAVNMKSAGGEIIHISEWVGQEAIDRAHRMPEVLALWKRFEACSEFVPLSRLGEVGELFATFESVWDQ